MNFTKKYMPKKLDEIIGQKKLFSKNSVLRRLVESGEIPHSFFYGPPGSGKTTTANVIAKTLGYDFYTMDAANFKISDLRNIIKKKDLITSKPVIFIDEVHRLSKNQQEALLIPMEREELLLIGASTRNPYYSLTAAIRSRSFLFEFEKLSKEDLIILINKVAQNENLTIDHNTKMLITEVSSGDARVVLNLLDTASKIGKKITSETIKELKNIKYKNMDENKRYDLMSALIKSMRGGDIDASLYYLAGLIVLNEPPEHIARRLVIFSSEDIGNANPNALNIAVNTFNSVKEIGYPESRIILSQCVIYLASSPKSDSSYKAIENTLDYINKNGLKIPDYLKLNSNKYKNPHIYKEKQKYMFENLKFYKSNDTGFEKTLKEWIKNKS